MAEILLYDYSEVDPYWGDEIMYCIGQGKLSAGVITPQIQAASGVLTVRVNSQGGKVFDGWAIYNSLIAYKKIAGNSVIVRIEGIAASIASIICMAGDEVIMCQASMMMIHKPSGFYFGQMDADDLQKEANSLIEVEAVLIDIYASKTGLSSNKLQNMIDAETWLSPDTAIALSFADMVEKISNEKPTIAENVFNKLFANAAPAAKMYANSIFTIKNQNMSTVKDLMDKSDKTNTLLEDILNFFKKEPKNENADADPEADKVEETVDAPEEETVDSLKKKVEELEAEKADNAEIVNSANAILDKANAKYDEVVNLLKEVKSNYKPEPEQREFRQPEAKAEGGNFVKPSKKK